MGSSDGERYLVGGVVPPERSHSFGMFGEKMGGFVKSSRSLGGLGGGWSLFEQEYFAMGDGGCGVGSDMSNEWSVDRE